MTHCFDALQLRYIKLLNKRVSAGSPPSLVPKVALWTPKGFPRAPQEPPRPQFGAPGSPQGLPRLTFWTPKGTPRAPFLSFWEPWAPFCGQTPSFPTWHLKKAIQEEIIIDLCNITDRFCFCFQKHFPDFVYLPSPSSPMQTEAKGGLSTVG